MRERLHFIWQVLRHWDRLIIGYETTQEMPDGDCWTVRYLNVGGVSEMELDLSYGEFIRFRNGDSTFYTTNPEEA